MKKKFGLALVILFAIAATILSVSNVVPPAWSGAIHGTTTLCPGGLPPLNDIFRLYDDYSCLYEPHDCSVVWAQPI